MKEIIKQKLNYTDDEVNQIFEEFKNNDQLKDLVIDSFDKYWIAVELIRDSKEPSFKGYFKKLQTDPYWELVIVPTREQASENRRLKLLTIVGEDSRDFKATFKDFDTHTNKRKRAIQLSERIYNEMKVKEETNSDKLVMGLYMFSPGFQIGKTYLANAIANELADIGISGVFVFVPNLALQAKDFENVHKLINDLKVAKILVLDDLGAEYRSEWFRLEVLMPVLQYRLSSKLLTIITSNYSTQELKSLYSQNTRGKDVDRLMSRILELTTEIELDG